MIITNKKIAHAATLALLDGTQPWTIYSNEEASISLPILQRERSGMFLNLCKEVKATESINLAKELTNICNMLNIIVEHRKIKSHITHRSKINEFLESLDACLDKTISESESSGPSTPAEIGLDMNDVGGSRKFSSTSTNSVGSERSELSSSFSWNFESSYTLKSTKDPIGTGITPIREIYLSEVYIDAILAGWLNKLRINNTSFFNRKSWKRRLLVLTQTHLYQFKSSAAQSKSINAFEISASTVVSICEKYPEKRWVLEIRRDSQLPWFIQAESMKDLKTWLNSLRAAVIRAKYAIRTLPQVPLGSASREMIRRTSPNNVQSARPRIPRPSRSMSYAQSSSSIQSNGCTKAHSNQPNQITTCTAIHPRRQSKPKIDINISHSPFFDNNLLASLSSSPTKTTFPPTISKKPSPTLPPVKEC